MTTEFALALAVVLLAGFANGLTGFGFALISVPPLLLIYEPRTVVAVRLLLTLASGWLPLLDSWRAVRLRALAGIVPWAVAGLFVGIRLLQALPPAWIKLLASGMVVAFALLLLSGRLGVATVRAESWRSGAAAGLASGTLATSTGLSGPPVVMLFTLRNYEATAFRATIIAYFLILDVVGLPSLLLSEAIHWSDVRTAAILTPAAVAGRFLGMGLVKRVSAAAFRRITLALLLATGVAAVVSAVEDLVG